MRTFLLASLAFALLVSGCASTTSTPSTSGAPVAPDHVHMGPMTHDVSMKGNKFVPDTMTIHKGDTVRWTHADGMTTPHNVVADDGSFDSNPMCDSTVPVPVPLAEFCMVQGNTFEHTFDALGSVPYKCRVHSGMTGTIIVVAENVTLETHMH